MAGPACSPLHHRSLTLSRSPYRIRPISAAPVSLFRLRRRLAAPAMLPRAARIVLQLNKGTSGVQAGGQAAAMSTAAVAATAAIGRRVLLGSGLGLGAWAAVADEPKRVAYSAAMVPLRLGRDVVTAAAMLAGQSVRCSAVAPAAHAGCLLPAVELPAFSSHVYPHLTFSDAFAILLDPVEPSSLLLPCLQTTRTACTAWRVRRERRRRKHATSAEPTGCCPAASRTAGCISSLGNTSACL